jgi:hypothetical protein
MIYDAVYSGNQMLASAIEHYHSATSRLQHTAKVNILSLFVNDAVVS